MAEFKKYHYSGPTYHNGHKISAFSNLYTMARSYKEARRNFLFTVAGGDYINHYDIVDHYITLVEDDKVDTLETEVEIKKCERCGYQLTDSGECPVCDFGEYDLLEAMKELNEIV